MPEGDTLYRTAVTLRKALLGRVVTRFETSLDTVRRVDEDTPVAGRTITNVEARGKHLLITLAVDCGLRIADCGLENAVPEVACDRTVSSAGTEGARADPAAAPAGTEGPQSAIRNPQSAIGDLVLHTHLRMTGSWHIYRPGEAWQKPARLAVVTLYTEAFVAPCFSAPVVELLTARQAARHPSLVSLGPDAMTAEFDAEAALARMRRRPEVEIGVALMDQRLMAGVGNVYKSEVLFLRRVSPFLKVGELDDAALEGLIAEAHRLMRLNAERGERRTRFGLREHERLWVYGRSGEPCRVCGETLRMRRQGMDARSTYYCPVCQPGPVR